MSMQDGLSGFLYEAGSFMRLVRLKVSQKLDDISLLSASILKSSMTI